MEVTKGVPTMMKHLLYTDRLKIEWCFSHGIVSKKAIAHELNCSLSTVYHEFKRDCWYWHTDPEFIDHCRYSAMKAQQDYDWKNSIRGQHDKIGNNWEFINFIEKQILSGVSPARALYRWNKQNTGFTVSVKTLYRYIDSGLYFTRIINKNLIEKPFRKRSYNHTKVCKSAPAGHSIEKRPLIIADRSTFGHWEMDSIIGKARGKRESLLVLTERLTRYEIVLRADSKTSAATVQSLRHISRLCNFPDLFKTITVDNGSEFKDCKGIEQYGTTVYYCHPYTSCERGSNERNNRVLRRYFPKGKSLSKITGVDCRRAAMTMNDMERKALDWYTPRQLFEYYTSKENIEQKLSNFY
jgi:IS30 family transposase